MQLPFVKNDNKVFSKMTTKPNFVTINSIVTVFFLSMTIKHLFLKD